MEEISLAFEKIGLHSEVNKIVSKRKKAFVKICSSSSPYKKLEKYIRMEIFYYIRRGHQVNNNGLGLAGYMRNLGYELPDIFLAHKLADQGLTTHYFSLQAEETSSFLLSNREILSTACKSFSSNSFRYFRLFLVFLQELSRINLEEYLIYSLRIRNREDVENLPPLVQVFIKASCIE